MKVRRVPESGHLAGATGDPVIQGKKKSRISDSDDEDWIPAFAGMTRKDKYV